MNNKISLQTIIRTVVLTLTLINQTLTMLGKNPLPFATSDIYELLTTLATIGAAAWAWWKNNSVTQAAITADKYLKDLKEGVQK